MLGTEKVRRHYLIEGRVQGVGFRYRACCAAQSLGITGWVKNREDGRVEMELQGRPGELGRMFELLEKGSFIRMDSWETKELKLIKEHSFEIAN